MVRKETVVSFFFPGDLQFLPSPKPTGALTVEGGKNLLFLLGQSLSVLYLSTQNKTKNKEKAAVMLTSLTRRQKKKTSAKLAKFFARA